MRCVFALLPLVLLACSGDSTSDDDDDGGSAGHDDEEVDEALQQASDDFVASLEDWEVEYLYTLDWDTAVEEHLWTDPILRRATESLHGAWTDTSTARAGDGDCDSDEEAQAEQVKLKLIHFCKEHPPLKASAIGWAGDVPVHIGFGTSDAADDLDMDKTDITGIGMDCEEEGEPASAEDWAANNPCYLDTCVANITEEWGTHCGESSSFEVNFENQCDESLSVKWCIEDGDGTWDCGITTVDPGEVGGNGAWTCDGTGNYWLQAVAEGTYNEDCPFVGEPED